MSLNLLFIMTALLLADYVVGLLYEIWNEGFDKTKWIKGAQRYFLIFVGYGALALIAHLSSYYFEEMQYLSGLLLEPIARYFVSLLDRLKGLFLAEQENSAEKKIKNQKAQETLKETAVNVEAVPMVFTAPKEETVSAEETAADTEIVPAAVTVPEAEEMKSTEVLPTTALAVVTAAAAETAARPKRAQAKRRTQSVGKNVK